MGIEMAADWRLIGAVFFGLFCFGCGYAALTAWIGDRKQGYTSLMVVGGVLVTLLGVALVSWPSALLTAGAFIASGTPMIVGEIVTYKRREAEALRRMKDEIDGKA